MTQYDKGNDLNQWTAYSKEWSVREEMPKALRDAVSRLREYAKREKIIDAVFTVSIANGEFDGASLMDEGAFAEYMREGVWDEVIDKAADEVAKEYFDNF